MISHKIEPVTKVITIGASGVGKTALLRRIETGKFSNYYNATIGSAFFEKTIDGEHFELWDTAGQERYRSAVPQYYRNAKIIILMFDVSNLRTLEELSDFIFQLSTERLYHPDAKFIIIGNKTDLAHQDTNEITKLFQQNPLVKSFGIGGYEPYYISVKDDENIDIITQDLVIYSKAFSAEIIHGHDEKVHFEKFPAIEPDDAECSC